MTPRNLFALTALVLLAGLALFLVVGNRDALARRPLGDFAEYWAAGTLALAGENPYDIERVRELENAAGRPGEPVLMWNPPWTLLLVLPLGKLDVRTAQTIWQLGHVLILMLCAQLFGRLYLAHDRQALGWLAVFTFMPCYVAIVMGQIAPLLPLGVLFFLLAIQRGHDFLAGLACSLLTIKPHATLLLWIALALWLLHSRRWAIVGGIMAGIAVGLSIPLVLNPNVLFEYRAAVTEHPPTQYLSPTWGAVLRLWFGQQHFWLQFLSPLVGITWLLVYWWHNRRTWDWSEQLPLVLLVSVCTMAYGWFYDLVLVLPAIAQIASRSQVHWPTLFSYGAINLFALLQVAFGAHGVWFIWAAPALLVLYVVQAHRARVAKK